MIRNVTLLRILPIVVLIGLLIAFSFERDVGGRVKVLEPEKEIQNRIILISVPGLNWDRFMQLYELGGTTSELVDSGMVGLMNTNSAYRRQVEHGYLTMNSGYPAEATTEIHFFSSEDILPFEQSAIEVYRRYNGSVPDGDFFLLEPKQLHNLNQSSVNESRVGTLGEILKANGVGRFVYGNSDIYLEDKGRLASLMLIDKGGSVSSSFVEEAILIDPEAPTFFRTDNEKITEKLEEQGKGVHLIEYGDFIRLESLRGSIPEVIYSDWEREFLFGLDELLRGIVEISNGDPLILFNPGLIGNEFSQANWLMPLVVWDGENSGFLSSGATKRLGLVTNLDVSKSIVEMLGIEGEGLGQVLVSQGKTDIYLLEQFFYETKENHLRRTPLIQGYVTMLILVMIGLVVLMLKKHALVVLVPYGLYVLLLIPLVYLLLPLIGVTGLWESVLASVVLVIGLLFPLSFFVRRDFSEGIAVIAGFTLLVILLDLLTGSHLLITSPLGYSALGGARYYGIGNEYMGLLVGALLILGTVVVERHRQLESLLIVFWIGGILLIGLPSLGANFGGLLTSGVAFSYAILSLGFRGGVIKKWLLIGGFVFLGLVVVILADFVFNAGSHIGQAFLTIREGGLQALGEIIYRKASLNWKLIKYTIWTRVLLTSVLIVALLVFRPSGMFRRIMEKKPVLSTGIAAGVIGGLVALVVNDSGVVAAATAMIYPTSMLILLVNEEIMQDQGNL